MPKNDSLSNSTLTMKTGKNGRSLKTMKKSVSAWSKTNKNDILKNATKMNVEMCAACYGTCSVCVCAAIKYLMQSSLHTHTHTNTSIEQKAASSLPESFFWHARRTRQKVELTAQNTYTRIYAICTSISHTHTHFMCTGFCFLRFPFHTHAQQYWVVVRFYFSSFFYLFLSAVWCFFLYGLMYLASHWIEFKKNENKSPLHNTCLIVMCACTDARALYV